MANNQSDVNTLFFFYVSKLNIFGFWIVVTYKTLSYKTWHLKSSLFSLIFRQT